MKKLYLINKTICILLCFFISLSLVSCSVTTKEIHGTDLLNLTDDQLYEKVYSQTLELVESYPDEETALDQISTECKTIYILSIFDMEIQNGGLCQFFVNSSRSLAPYVNECLKRVNANDHEKLFFNFVTKNNIDLEHLESFEIEDIGDYYAQAKKCDFDSFDIAYYKLTPLQNYMIAYIKNNISKF